MCIRDRCASDAHQRMVSAKWWTPSEMIGSARATCARVGSALVPRWMATCPYGLVDMGSLTTSRRKCSDSRQRAVVRVELAALAPIGGGVQAET
eukprot:2049284-Prymnesium_polylepis.1